MSTATIDRPAKFRKQAATLQPAVYTICPVLVASHIAVHHGWLDAEIRKAGGVLKYLWSLESENWLSHFGHTLPNQFRDGGNIPAIHARSQGRRTKLIGLTFSNDGGQILARVGSQINKVTDLKGRRLGLYKRVNTDRVDFWRATAHRAILVALDLAGLGASDVQVVDLPVTTADYPSTDPWKGPTERFNDANAKNSAHYHAEIEALLAGEVDAIYAPRARANHFQQSGKIKAIEDLSRYPDWTVQVANSPYTITVSEDLAKTHPEIVVAYLRAVIRAGLWIENHPASAASIFSRILAQWASPLLLEEEIAKYRFVPNLSAKNLAGIDLEKKFLLDHSYIAADFPSEQWVDARFLDEALSSI